jgi:putative endonuclease
MWHVYLLQSTSIPKKTYIGITRDVEARLSHHNGSGTNYTAKWRPWRLIAYISVQTREDAAQLEKYLKQGSGSAWAHKHLWVD